MVTELVRWIQALWSGAEHDGHELAEYPGVPLGVLAEHTPVRVRSWLHGSWMEGFEIAAMVAEDNDILATGCGASRIGPCWVRGCRPTT